MVALEHGILLSNLIELFVLKESLWIISPNPYVTDGETGQGG
jgi:hypothetical protein